MFEQTKTSEATLTSDVLILFQHLHYIPAACPADTTTSMHSAAAEIKIIERCLVIRPARDWTHEHELIEHDLTVIEVAFGETVGGFQIKWREGLCVFD